MKKGKITPFDVETACMIESVMNCQVEFCEYLDEFQVIAEPKAIDEKTLDALEAALRGRLGNRYLNKYQYENTFVFEISYAKDSENMPEEVRGDFKKPNWSVGIEYARRPESSVVRAVPVLRKNAQLLTEFVGNGFFVIPKTIDATATFAFITDNGVFKKASEKDYIVTRDNKTFYVVTAEDFEKRYFVSPNGYYTERFGDDLQKRIFKLREEFNELIEVAEKSDYLNDKSFVLSFVEELADVNAVLGHIAGIIGLSYDELVVRAFDKIKGRETNPDYKRTHEHETHCGECDKFENEDVSGFGYCSKCDKTKYCWDKCELDLKKWKNYVK